MTRPEDLEPETRRRLRALPAVDRLAIAVARAELAERRARLLSGGSDEAVDEAELVAAARGRLAPGVPRVLNATGVVLHTNLGRAPLAGAARRAVWDAAEGYTALEVDLGSGARTRRGRRAEMIVAELCGAADAAVVNNGAAAVLLAVASLAGAGGAVAISRGELVEIGGGARIADIVAACQVRLIEVGATNRTTLGDYAAAIDAGATAILRVHQSNFTMTGYVGRPDLRELTGLGIGVIDDIGSGALAADVAVLAGEPAAADSIRDGAALVAFSGDKLLGGPQAGILAGAATAVDVCRRHPLARAMRIDKLRLAALEATLDLHLDRASASREVPVLAMLTRSRAELEPAAERLAELTGGEVVDLAGEVGGGALPGLRFDDPAVALDPGPAGAEALAAALRRGRPALLGRIRDGRVLLAVRTLTAAELELAAECVLRARRQLG